MQELNFNSNINSRCIVLRFVDFYFLNNYRIEGCFTWKYESGWNEISLVIIFQELNINFRNVSSFLYVLFIYLLFLLCFCWVFLIFLTLCLRILGYFYNIFLLWYLVCTCFFFLDSFSFLLSPFIFF